MKRAVLVEKLIEWVNERYLYDGFAHHLATEWKQLPTISVVEESDIEEIADLGCFCAHSPCYCKASGFTEAKNAVKRLIKGGMV